MPMEASTSMAHAAMAERHLNDHQGIERHRPPGGSSMGRLMWRSRTRTAGIRFEWVTRSTGPVLRVVATWKDHCGHPRHTSFSVQCNGLEGALDRAIASRCSCGAPLPNRADLLQRLQQEFATAPHQPQTAPHAQEAVECAETAGMSHFRQLPYARHAVQSGGATASSESGAA
jgi:hypothetical protein